MTGVLGLDLACAQTGVALPSGRCTTWRPPSPPPKRTVAYRGLRAHWYFGRTVAVLRTYEPDLVVIEQAAGHGHAHSLVAIAYVRAAVEIACYEAGIEVVEVGPMVLKKWATTHGNADKAAMVAAAEARGARPTNDDEADAALLRFWGLQLRGEG